MQNNLKLLELFTSFQGEGKNTGQLCTFIRFKTCNLKCSFCDTMIKMEYDPEATYDYETIYKLGLRTNRNFVITGGEPTLIKYREDIVNLFKYLNKEYDKDINTVEIETNGFDIKGLLNDLNNILSKETKILVNISPKYIDREDLIDDILNDSINQLNTLKTENISNFEYIYKLVAYDYLDNFKTTKYTIEYLLNNNIPSDNIYIMPEGISKENLIIDNKKIMEICLKYSINFTSRLHIMHNFN